MKSFLIFPVKLRSHRTFTNTQKGATLDNQGATSPYFFFCHLQLEDVTAYTKVYTDFSLKMVA